MVTVIGYELGLISEVALRLATLYFVGMVCHGELVALRPGTRHLTLFYLAVSAGGALGGALVAPGAPLVFDGYWELHVGLALAAAVATFAFGREWLAGYATRKRLGFALATAIAAGLTVMLSIVFWRVDTADAGGIVLQTRGFYGALHLRMVGDDPQLAQLQLVHGRTVHGVQFLSPERRRWRTSYYSTASGVGTALENHPARLAGQPLRVGLVGLGTGTLATYLEDGDYARFYEINPQVLELANERFTYLEDARAAGADLEVLLGDARIVLERQLAEGDSQRFDVLAVDAFSSDAIPVHLLTSEAIELYQQHLGPGGVIAVHISNRYLDLGAVVRAVAAARGLEAHLVVNEGDADRGISPSRWVLVTDNRAFLDTLAVEAAMNPWGEDDRAPVWTDDYSALLAVLRF